MREFKFRAWNEFQMLSDKDLRKTAEELYTETGKSGQYENCIIIPNCEDIVVMQYTGLKDRNGKEIYEDDIVEFYSLSEDGMTLGVVSYDEGMYIIGDYILRKHIRSCVVKGNIYENPELLK